MQSDMKHWPFKVVAKADGKPLIEVNYMGEKKDLHARGGVGDDPCEDEGDGGGLPWEGG